MTADAQPLTIGAVLGHALQHWPDAPALRLGDWQVDHRTLLAQSERCARALMAQGIGRGDRVGLFLPNRREYLILLHGLGLIGAVAVTMNARLKAEDLRFAVAKARLSALVTCRDSPHFDGLALAAGLGLAKVPVIDAGAGWAAFLHEAAQTPQSALADARAQVRPEDDWLIMFSSGTTAAPKACRLSHRAVILSAAGMADRFGIAADDRFWDPLPLFHMSTILPMTACRLRGALFTAVAHFDPGPALAEIEATRATIAYPAFPTLMAGMIAHPDFARRDLSAVRLTLAVGPADLLARFQAAWPNAVQVSCYGLTEAGGLSCYNRPDDPLPDRLQTSGHPIGGMQVRIVDTDSGAVLGPDMPGEIQLRGATLFSGYFDDPDLTRATMTAEGWLKTGDLGRITASGNVAYTGRAKDMLRVGGENVAAAEIESYLVRHPQIRLAQVIGVPDARLDEVPAAFVELEDGATLTEADVVAFCRGQIAGFKVPRFVRIVTDWPMSATKIQKFRLKEGFRPDRRFDP